MKLRKFKTLMLAGVTAMSLQATKVDALLAGVKTTGMAATSVSHPIDAFAGAYNPASITNLPDRIDLGVSWVQTHQGAMVRDLPTNYLIPPGVPPSFFDGYRDGAKTPNTYVPEFGVNMGWFRGSCAFGRPVEYATSLILYNRNDLKTTYGKAFELFGTTPTGLDYIHETGAFVLAAKFDNMHSIGVAINYNIQRLKLDGLESFDLPSFTDAPGKTTNRGYDYSHGVGCMIGYLLEIDNIKFGIGWQPKTKMGDFDKYSGFIADFGKFDIPMRYTAGISYRFLCNLTVAFDYEFIKWKGIPELQNKTFPNLANNLLGSPNGAGFGWRNQNYFRLGFEYVMNKCFTLRAGFRHASSPITPKWTAVNILTLDCMENVVTFGATWNFNPWHEFSFFYAAGMQKKIRGNGSIPATIPQPNAQGQKVSLPINFNIDTGGVGNGEIDLKQRRSALGIAWGWKFYHKE